MTRFSPVRIVIAVVITACLALPVCSVAATQIPSLLVAGDEPVVVTQHQLHTPRGVLNYEAYVGRLPIRNDETGEVRGHMFFVAYHVNDAVKTTVKRRPLTIIWDGGPTVPAIFFHILAFGPRILEGDGFVDNVDTLLYASDLVFVDPVGTGFSRPEKAEFEAEFTSVLGDFAALAEFVRAFRLRFAAEDQPLFLLGNSYGTWRVSGVTEILTKHGVKVAGSVLLSGGIPGSKMPAEFNNAYFVQARTAAAFEHKRLAPDLMRDRTATLRAVNDWVANTYLPALRRAGELSDAQREQIAQDLARYTGIGPDQIDRKTLVMSNHDYCAGFFRDPAKQLDGHDMRRTHIHQFPHAPRAVSDYLRGELGYRTDLAYTNPALTASPFPGDEDGYMPTPGPARRFAGANWAWNHVEVTPEAMAAADTGDGPPQSQPWLQNALRADPDIRVFVAAGRFDSLNMCEGNELMAAKLGPQIARRFTLKCYDGPHSVYIEPAAHTLLSKDLEQFITASSSHPASEKTVAEVSAIPRVITRHRITLNQQTIDYSAEFVERVLVDKVGRPQATISATAYIRNAQKEVADRPVMFLFNGGPGASSSPLHFAVLGPKLIEQSPDGTRHMIDNPQSLIDVTDLVFIDPVGTGFSRVLEGGTGSPYWNVPGDAKTVLEFIRDWLSDHSRTTSPVYIAGESYGGMRLAMMLGDGGDLNLAGLLFISPGFGLGKGTVDDMSFIFALPSLAVAAVQNGKADAHGRSVPAVYEMATAFAMSDYAAALLQGSALPPAELDRVATRMVQLIGLPKEQIVARNLRIDMEEYRTALLKDQGLVIGRLDSRVTAPVPRDQPNRPSEANDPALPLGANNMIVSDVMGDYMRNDLKVQTTRDYISLTLQVNFNWDWQVDAESSTAAKLLANIKSLMLKNPRAQLLLVGGYYDLAAPVLSSRYAITHAGLPMNRVKMVALETGHSAFEGEEGRKQMRTLLSDFLAKH